MDQSPAVALTASADAWPRAIETEIGAALCAIGRGKDFDFFDMHYQSCPLYTYQGKRLPKNTIGILLQPCKTNIVLFIFIKLNIRDENILHNIKLLESFSQTNLILIELFVSGVLTAS